MRHIIIMALVLMPLLAWAGEREYVGGEPWTEQSYREDGVLHIVVSGYMAMLFAQALERGEVFMNITNVGTGAPVGGTLAVPRSSTAPLPLPAAKPTPALVGLRYDAVYTQEPRALIGYRWEMNVAATGGDAGAHRFELTWFNQQGQAVAQSNGMISFAQNDVVSIAGDVACEQEIASYDLVWDAPVAVSVGAR